MTWNLVSFELMGIVLVLSEAVLVLVLAPTGLLTAGPTIKSMETLF